MLFTAYRRVLRLAALAAAAVGFVVACGGDQTPAIDARNEVVRSDAKRVQVQAHVQGGAEAHAASVSFIPLGTQTPTVRVANDANGAPPLPADAVPASPIAQFSPLGMGAAAIDIRVPFDAAAVPVGTSPRLLLATREGGWAVAAQARQDGNALVARVPELTHAVVVAVASEGSDNLRKSALSDRQSGDGPLSPLSMTVESATPALPEPDALGIVRLRTATQLTYHINYSLPAGCTRSYSLHVYAYVDTRSDSGTVTRSQVTLAYSDSVPGPTGTWLQPQTLGTSQNGLWTLATTMNCVPLNGPTLGYPVTTAGPIIDIDVANGGNGPGTAPVITQTPADVSVVAGQLANFTVTASGSGLSYQWQRSTGDATQYADVPGATAASYTLTAALGDNNNLWRVRVSNGAGTTFSSAARLTVTARAIAPAINSDPANQSVIEGQTASFTVAGTGAPIPSVQWQTLTTATSAWSDITGATTPTYITAPTTLSQSGDQVRAVLQNAAGSATSLPATLTVTAQTVAPAITSQPQSVSVQAGNGALFSLTASGSSPLSYQWFKDGVTVPGANATELLLPTVAADAGSSFQITASVSNGAGSVTTSAAVLTVTAVPSEGTLISAAQGGVVTAGTGAETDPALVIPPGALAADTVIQVTIESSSVANLPPEIVPLGDVFRISPSNLSFVAPVRLTVPVPEDLPEGKVLAVVEIEATQAAARSAAQLVRSAGALRRLGTSKPLTNGLTILAAGNVLNVLCGQTANQTTSGRFDMLVSGARRLVMAAVPEASCSGTALAPPLGGVPTTKTDVCRGDSEFSDAVSGGTRQTLHNRHLNCQKEQAEISLLSEKGAYGTFKVEMRMSSHGPASGPVKKHSVSLRLTKISPAAPGEQPLPTLTMRPRIECSSQQYAGTCTHALKRISVGANSGWTTPIDVDVNFNWSAGEGTWNEFSFFDVGVQYVIQGTLQNLDVNPSTVSFRGPPTIRCDKGIAQVNTTGCVYPEAAAVYVLGLRGDGVDEAAEHVAEAQSAGSPGGFTLAAGTRAIAGGGFSLQRAKSDSINQQNRTASCRSATALIRARTPPKVSSTCSPDAAGCQCDEYPFASTWRGGAIEPASTSVKWINGQQNNRAGGGRLTNWFRTERVLDFTDYTGLPTSPYDPALINNRGGDDFWVYIKP